MVQNSRIEENGVEDIGRKADLQTAHKIKSNKKQQRKRKRKLVIEDVLGDFSLQTGSYF